MSIIDRYPIDPTGPGWLADELRELKRRLGELEGRAPLGRTTMRDGQLIFKDNATGTVEVIIGKQDDGSWAVRFFDDDGERILELAANGLSMFDSTGLRRAHIGALGADYGVLIEDGAAGDRFLVDGDGYHDPWLSHPWRGVPSPERQSTMSPTFMPLWSSDVELVTHKGVACTAAWVTDVGTTGEIRLRVVGGATTSAVALAAGSSGFQGFQWLHGLALGIGPVAFELEARVTAGAGSVHLDEPMSGCTMADPLQCTSTGLP